MQISDNIHLGPAFAGGSKPNTISDGDTQGSSLQEEGVGPMGRIYVLDVVPKLVGTTTSISALSASANLPAGALVLQAAFTSVAGDRGVTLVVGPDGVSRYTFDCARSVMFYSASDLSSKTLTISGYDIYGQPMSQVVTGPNAGTSESTKCFKSVISIVPSGAIASAIMAGPGNNIGLPVRVTDLGYVTNCMFNQTAITISSTAVKVADITSPATTSTTDVRGYIVTASADSSKRLVVGILIPAIGCGPNATRIGAYGVTQV